MSIGICFRAWVLAVLLALPLSGCLFRTHRVDTSHLSQAELQTASATQLIDRLNATARGVRTLNAVVDIDTDVGGEKSGKVTEYQEIRGYILVRQPGELRMIGLMPVIRNRAFDMVSSGSEFKLWIPPKNKFYIGQNDAPAPGARGLTSLRPQIIYDSLLLNDIDSSQGEIAVLESGTQFLEDHKSHKTLQQPDYRIDVLQHGANGWYLARKVYFSRVDLQPQRQVVYDVRGNIATESLYDGWKLYENVWFPSVIEIRRPVEEYKIILGLIKVTLNEPLTDEQFQLPRPEGAEVIQLDGVPRTQSATSKTQSSK